MNAGGTCATLSTGAFDWKPSGKQLTGFKTPDRRRRHPFQRQVRLR